MCCLFGMLDSQNKLTVKQKNHIIRALSLSAEEREIGGLGIFMVKSTMDDVIYEYKDGQNILKPKKL